MNQDLGSIATALVADGKGILAAAPIPLGCGFRGRKSACKFDPLSGGIGAQI